MGLNGDRPNLLDESRVSISECIRIGLDLRRELERLARPQALDATSLGRRVLTDYVTHKRSDHERI